MLLKHNTFSDTCYLRLLQIKNLFSFTNLQGDISTEGKVLLFSIVRYRGKEGKREYIASYNPNTYIYTLNDDRFATYNDLLNKAWTL